MFSKMLIATDLSAASERVICSLGNLKNIGVREVLLIHCFNIRDVGTLANQLMELSRPSFEKQKKLLEDLGFETHAKMVLGLPQIEINRLADEHDCSFIVIGSHGQTLAGEIMLGGVASAIIHSATKPVLLVRLEAKGGNIQVSCEKWKCDFLHHVMFPTDFSDNAEQAFSYLKMLAEHGANQITLLHVQDKEKIGKYLKDRLDEFNRIDTERLVRLKDTLEKIGVQDIRIEIPFGSPKQEIINRTRKDDISLVVMGSKGRGYIGELLLGSVSHAVARHSDATILLIPPL